MKEKTNSHPSEKGIRAAIFSMIFNLALSVIKWIAGYLGNSYALIADAFESLSDVASSFVVLIGLKISAKEPDIDHPYGHGKAEPIAAALVGLSLVIASVLIAYQSIVNIKTPHQSPASYTLLVLGIVIVSKEFLFKKLSKVSDITGSAAVKSDAWHQRIDALTSACAFIGILIALIGGKGFEVADDWTALITCLFISYNGYSIIRPALAEIMDTAPPENIVHEIKKLALQTEGVMAIDKCIVRKMGFDYYVDIHVVVDGNLTVREGHDIAHKVQDQLFQSYLRIPGANVHIEPFNANHAKQ